MSEHKLGDILRHYGVEGMKWDVRRTPEQLAAARKAQDEASSREAFPEAWEALDKVDKFIQFMDEFGKDFREARDNIKDIPNDIKDKGKSMLSNLKKGKNSFLSNFKIKTTTERIQPKYNAKATKELREMAKKDANLNRNNTPKVFDKKKGWIVPPSVGGMKTRTTTKGNTTRRTTTATSEGRDASVPIDEAVRRAAALGKSTKKKKWYE